MGYNDVFFLLYAMPPPEVGSLCFLKFAVSTNVIQEIEQPFTCSSDKF